MTRKLSTQSRNWAQEVKKPLLPLKWYIYPSFIVLCQTVESSIMAVLEAQKYTLRRVEMCNMWAEVNFKINPSSKIFIIWKKICNFISFLDFSRNGDKSFERSAQRQIERWHIKLGFHVSAYLGRRSSRDMDYHHSR